VKSVRIPVGGWKWYLYLLAFTTGAVTLGIEFVGSRMLESVFGSSNIVWAMVIGLILLYLTLGYAIGGRIADRRPSSALLFQIVIWAAFCSALVPLVSRPILSAAATAFSQADAGLVLGSLTTTLILFSVPITMFGMVSPFVIRLALPSATAAGSVSGTVYAIGTVGSLVGTFGTVLVLIPLVGTTRSALFLAALAYSVAWIGLFGVSPRRAIWYLTMPLAITVLLYVYPGSPLRAAPPGSKVLIDEESAYHYIQVVEDAGGYRYLYLNEGQGIHSQWHPTEYLFDRTWGYFLAAPYFNSERRSPPERLLIVGLATGTIARQYAHFFPGISVDGVELDARILEVGAALFELNTESIPGLKTIAGDGRWELRGVSGNYDVVAIDAYRPPYIPWHLTTVEYYREIRDLLSPQGVVAINVGRTDRDRRLVDALTATLSEVFASVSTVDVPGSFNTILYATTTATSGGGLSQRLAEGLDPEVQEQIRLVESNLVANSTDGIVLRDDHAPVEFLVDRLVFEFLLGGGLEAFQP
jgi:spermidine synthase